MGHYLTVIAPEKNAENKRDTNAPTIGLDEKIINLAFRLIERRKGRVLKCQWLSPDEACDIHFESEKLPTAEAMATFKEKHQVDLILQEESPYRRKKILICDMDSTIIQQECIDEIADCLGIKDQVASITKAAMEGELDFAEALRERVSLLKGVTKKQLEEVFTNRITLTPGARTLVQTMKAHGGRSLLISGGFTFFTERVTEATGFDNHVANGLNFAEDALSGTVSDPIIDKNAKLTHLQALAKEHECGAAGIMAIGDGANDLPMLEAAGLGVGYHAHTIVQETIPAHITYTTLTSALFAQGYKRSEFVE